MIISLNPDQEAWLQTRVTRGDFATIEEAVRQLLAERIAERAAGESADLSWAKPSVDVALADVARGAVITLEEHEARIDARLAAMT